MEQSLINEISNVGKYLRTRKRVNTTSGASSGNGNLSDQLADSMCSQIGKLPAMAPDIATRITEALENSGYADSGKGDDHECD